MSQIVQVVSILEVMMRLGESVFQSSDVKGAVCSGDFEFESSASGVSLASAESRPLDERTVIELEVGWGVTLGNDHNRRWSPEVAKRSVDCFLDDGGSHNIRVTGYVDDASANLVNSSPCVGPPGDGRSGPDGRASSVSRICIYQPRRVGHQMMPAEQRCKLIMKRQEGYKRFITWNFGEGIR